MSFKLFLEKLSLEFHEQLNSKLWNEDETLKSDVRNTLLKIAYAWAKFCNIEEKDIKEIYFTGGNAARTYTDLSDIDLHILVDKYSKYPEHKELVDDYYKDKKSLWTLKHDITIKGYPVETYVQDIDEKIPDGQGVYSILNNKWIQKSDNLKMNWDSDKFLEHKIDCLKHHIDKMIEDKENIQHFDDLRKKLKNKRSLGIEKHGEFSTDNLIFKDLRNTGYLDKINKYLSNYKDNQLSLK